MDAWRNPRGFFSYKMPVELNIKGYSDVFPWGKFWWNQNLSPKWRELINLSLEEVCANSWLTANEAILKYLPELESQGNAILVHYEELITHPSELLTKIAEVIEIPADENLTSPNLPIVMTGTKPSKYYCLLSLRFFAIFVYSTFSFIWEFTKHCH